MACGDLVDRQKAMKFFEDNQLIIAVAFGALLAFFRGLPELVFSFAMSRVTVSLEILDKDEAYRWVNAWLSETMSHKKTRNLMVNSYPAQDGTSRYRVNLVPGIGLHTFRFEGIFGVAYKLREKSDGVVPTKTESLVIRMVTRDVTLAHRLVNQAMEIATRPEPGIVDVYIPRWGYWSKAGTFEARSLSSLILPKGDWVIRDMREFLSSRQVYRQRGIPYQRGYLLYGPPGNGKTSFVKALAGELSLSVYLIDLGDKKLSDLELQWLFASIPNRSLLLLEDIDRAEVNRKSTPSKPKSKAKIDEPEGPKDEGISLSGLLNALDGILSGETGRIVIMTSNHPELLPEALVRPGRIDKKVYFPNARKEDAEEALRRFFNSNGSTPAVPDVDMSFADLQDILMTSHSAEEATRHMR